MLSADRPSLTVCRDLAELLEYPRPEVAPLVDACIAQLDAIDPPACDMVKQFRQALGETTGGQTEPQAQRLLRSASDRLEEIYTATFDMQPDRCLYVGHHLFGENRRRNLFLSLLKDHYQARGFSIGVDLPDYLPTMLRFVSEHENEPETDELVSECILPALRKLAAGDGLFAPLLGAVLRILERGRPDCTGTADVSSASGEARS